MSLFAFLAVAAAPPPPLPVITAADLAADPAKLGNPKKFFVFHRDGATFEEAYHDLKVCVAFANQPLFPRVPTSVAWTEPSRRQSEPPQVTIVTGGAGEVIGRAIVDAVIGQPVVAGVGRSLRAVNLSSCMLPRGYNRHVISEQMWKKLNGPDLAASLTMQARLAAGPRPSSPVTP